MWHKTNKQTGFYCLLFLLSCKEIIDKCENKALSSVLNNCLLIVCWHDLVFVTNTLGNCCFKQTVLQAPTLCCNKYSRQEEIDIAAFGNLCITLFAVFMRFVLWPYGNCVFILVGKFYCKPHYCYRLSGLAQRKRPAPAPAPANPKVLNQAGLIDHTVSVLAQFFCFQM